jgi:hypothetical protein
VDLTKNGASSVRVASASKRRKGSVPSAADAARPAGRAAGSASDAADAAAFELQRHEEPPRAFSG